jgi:hypothetical protein
MIIWAAVNYNGATPFPGLAAMLPCLGTVTAIYAGQAPITGLLLRNKLAVGIGLISYSLYLAHWPLIVFYKYWKVAPITEIESVLLIFTSTLLGFLMWRFVETPFRKPSNNKSFDSVQIWAPVAALGLMIVAANAWGSSGWPGRFPDNFFMTNEQIMEERDRYWEKSKKIDAGSDKPNVVVLGNSHAEDLIFSFQQNGAELNVTSLLSSHKCMNFGSPIFVKDAQECWDLKASNFMRNEWVSADAVYLSDHWPLLDLNDLFHTLQEVRRLTTAPIYVFGPKMWYTRDVPDIARSHMSLPGLNNYSKGFQKTDRQEFNNKLRQFFAASEFSKYRIYYVDVLEIQCGETYTECNIIADDGSFLYFDSNHFTQKGALEFGRKLKNEFPNLFDGPQNRLVAN